MILKKIQIMSKKERALNSKGEIVEVEVLSEEESRLPAGRYRHDGTMTLQELTERGFVPIEEFDRQLRNGSGR